MDAGSIICYAKRLCGFGKQSVWLKEGGLLVHSHSRQHTSGIRIPTSFAAVVGEWGNVRKQVSTWAWKGGSIVVAKKHAGSQRYNLLDKTMRCSRCEAYVRTIIRIGKGIISLFARSSPLGLPLLVLPSSPTQFDSTGVRSGSIMQTIRQKHGGSRRISGRHPSVCEPDARPFSTGPKRVVDKQRRKTR